ncbi:MAG: hypothetical protein H0T51_07895 [Pirellulales bacterium]|nr:hypothetical protein [Pirellulales bacterium]
MAKKKAPSLGKSDTDQLKAEVSALKAKVTKLEKDVAALAQFASSGKKGARRPLWVRAIIAKSAGEKSKRVD